MVVEDVAVEAIVKPSLEVAIVFEVLLEPLHEVGALAKVVYEESGSVAEINVRAAVSRETYDVAFSDWALFLDLKIDGLRVPAVHSA